MRIENLKLFFILIILLLLAIPVIAFIIMIAKINIFLAMFGAGLILMCCYEAIEKGD